MLLKMLSGGKLYEFSNDARTTTMFNVSQSLNG